MGPVLHGVWTVWAPPSVGWPKACSWARPGPVLPVLSWACGLHPAEAVTSMQELGPWPPWAPSLRSAWDGPAARGLSEARGRVGTGLGLCWLWADVRG